jgi:hypothetical protein
METAQQIILAPDNIPVLSKQNAATFHGNVKARIYETGNGLFEYIETIKFFAALDKVISGDTASKIDPDKEFLSYTREQIKLNADKDTFTTPRGVKFALAETGTSYDFSNCGDPMLERLENEAKLAADNVKARKEFLKACDSKGVIVTDATTGETVTVFPPTKTSKSSFKVSLPKA